MLKKFFLIFWECIFGNISKGQVVGCIDTYCNASDLEKVQDDWEYIQCIPEEKRTREICLASVRFPNGKTSYGPMDRPKLNCDGDMTFRSYYDTLHWPQGEYIPEKYKKDEEIEFYRDFEISKSQRRSGVRSYSVYLTHSFFVRCRKRGRGSLTYKGKEVTYSTYLKYRRAVDRMKKIGRAIERIKRNKKNAYLGGVKVIEASKRKKIELDIELDLKIK